jgi:hypothetical protein
MNWEQLKQHKVAILLGFLTANIFMLGFSELMIRRTTTRVIQRLEKKYSPSPYGPGLNPDLLNAPKGMDTTKKQKTNLEINENETSSEIKSGFLSSWESERAKS